MNTSSRREFLNGICRQTLYASVGLALVQRAGFGASSMLLARERLRFGALDPLVDLMQGTEADALLPLLVKKLKSGTPLSDLVGAGALANARGHGGTDYNGYHALMALVPSYEVAAQMPAGLEALPVLKVLHRNTRFLHDANRSADDALAPIQDPRGEGTLAEALRARKLERAERNLAVAESESTAQAWEEIQTVVRDEVNVHRVVLAWRAYDLLRLTGSEHGLTLLRQPVRFCIDEDTARAGRGHSPETLRALLAELMARHGLNERERGTRPADLATLERLAASFYASDRTAAAAAAAEALAAGTDPEDVGRALSLASARLLLHDLGQERASAGKPIGSVHGASIGVHASDAANAWRCLARVGSAKNAFASLIAGAYHTAEQAGGFPAHAHDHDAIAPTVSEPGALLDQCASHIRARDQKQACAAARRYCELGHGPEALFSVLLPFAVSEDGALHAEKFFRTAQEEHGRAQPAHRAIYLVALTRVMASHQGFPAPGVDEARRLLA